MGHAFLVDGLFLIRVLLVDDLMMEQDPELEEISKVVRELVLPRSMPTSPAVATSPPPSSIRSAPIFHSQYPRRYTPMRTLHTGLASCDASQASPQDTPAAVSWCTC